MALKIGATSKLGRLLHIATSLDVGGAQTMLVELASAKPGLADITVVASLLPGGFHVDGLRGAGIPVIEFDFRPWFRAPLEILRLTRFIREFRPDVVQGWLYHGDLAAQLALVLSGRRRATGLAWSIRVSDLELSLYGRALRLIVKICAVLSSFPDVIIANSVAGARAHRALGYRPKRVEVISNGIDVERFKPDPAVRAEVRRELNIADGAIVLAHVARVDPAKDHPCFLAAMSQNLHLEALLIGAGTEHLPAAPNLHRLGRRADVPRLMAAADFIISSSASEGFSNALAEGMACGLPAIATNVGAAASIVGDTGLVVPAGDPTALAHGICALASESKSRRLERSVAARARIIGEFSLGRAIQQFDEAYRRLVSEISRL